MAQDEDRKEEDEELLKLFKARKDWRQILREILSDKVGHVARKSNYNGTPPFTELAGTIEEVNVELTRNEIYDDRC